MNETKPIRIESAVAHRGGFLLTISPSEESVWVPMELYHKNRLKAGIVLTAPQLAQLRNEAEQFRCLEAARGYLAGRAHSIGELKLKLRKKNFANDAITSTIAELKKQRLLDDTSYAHQVVRQRLERTPSGRSFLVSLLQRKHVSREIAEAVVSDATHEMDETQLAIAALMKRQAYISQFELETARHKAYTYLARRGIGYAAAKEAFAKVYQAADHQTDENR